MSYQGMTRTDDNNIMMALAMVVTETRQESAKRRQRPKIFSSDDLNQAPMEP